jgi:hypothetical protein
MVDTSQRRRAQSASCPWSGGKYPAGNARSAIGAWRAAPLSIARRHAPGEPDLVFFVTATPATSAPECRSCFEAPSNLGAPGWACDIGNAASAAKQRCRTDSCMRLIVKP